MPGVRKHFIEPGQRFGRLTVLSVIRGSRKPRTSRSAICRCDCGSEATVTPDRLVSGHTQSCGCLQRERSAETANPARAILANTTHGLRWHPLYQTWRGMRDRCGNPKAADYPGYGARGITVCPRWHDVAAFIEDIERLIGPRPDGMTLDRRDNDRNYEPGNVRWATPQQQADNRRPQRPRGGRS